MSSKRKADDSNDEKFLDLQTRVSELQKQMLEMRQEMQDFKQDTSQRLAEIERNVNATQQTHDLELQLQRSMSKNVYELRDMMNSLVSGSWVSTFKRQRVEDDEPAASLTTSSGTIRNRQSFGRRSPPPNPPPATRSQPPVPGSSIVSRRNSNQAPSPTSTPNGSSQDPPIYKFKRTTNTVPLLWTEWTEGLDGGPSIQSLEDRWGAKWRPDQNERIFFSRRRVIIDEIRKRHTANPARDINDIIQELEHQRSLAGQSLNALSKYLKEEHQDEQPVIRLNSQAP